jgi:hypothetical protein
MSSAIASDGNHIEYRGLYDYRILLVAKHKYPNEWVVYIGPVPGESHSKEYKLVLDYGTAVPEDFAKRFFPEFGKGRRYTY